MVLLLEDDAIKGSHEKRAIETIYKGEILWKKNLKDGMDAVLNEDIEWVLLDMYFPLEAGERIYPECGLKFLRELEELGYVDLPVIVCSTVQMRLPGRKNVLECICYHQEIDLEQELKRIYENVLNMGQ